jgi:integrase
VDDKLQAKNWDYWLEFCSDARRDPYLLDCDRPIQQQLLIGFAARVRRGYYGRGRTVQAQTPETAVRHVAQAIVLAGYPDPRRSSGSKDLDLPFAKLFQTYKTEDPAPKPQLALPVRAIQCIVTFYRNKGTPLACAIADLLTIAFFFLLRPGEYTMPSARTKTCTVQFRRQDVRFFRNGQVLPHSAPLETLRQADAVRLFIDNQKNGQRGSTMHHTSLPGAFCPVKALANRVYHLHRLAPANAELPLSFVSPSAHISSSAITLAVRESVVLSGLLNSGYSPSRVSAHSLRASGAMALRLNNVGEDLIKKLGRWSSSTWLTYIHSQISSLTAGLSERMTIHHVFYNVGT